MRLQVLKDQRDIVDDKLRKVEERALRLSKRRAELDQEIEAERQAIRKMIEEEDA